MKNWIIFLTAAAISLLLSEPIYSQTVAADQLFRQSELHQLAIQENLTPNIPKRKSKDLQTTAPQFLHSGERCFVISELYWEVLSSKLSNSNYDFALYHAMSAEGITIEFLGSHKYKLLNSDTQKAPCLNAATIQRIAVSAQNILIDKGYITSRVLTPEQDISNGSLKLSLAVGQIGDIKVDNSKNKQTHANRAVVFNAFPTHKGKTLQLRDLEQGLENLRRLPTVDAEMEILPSEIQGSSDIAIHWQQRSIPIRLYLSADDSGSEATGRYLGTISGAWDNPLHLNDILSASYTKNLAAGIKVSGANGNTDKSSTDSYSLSYSAPYGYWLFSVGISGYRYNQIVAGINQNYNYSGKSMQGYANLSRVLYRDNKHKITADAGLWRKTTRSFIDDAELDVQRRRVGGWSAGISTRSYFDIGTLSTNINYKRGTRAFGAIPAPEEAFDEGTGKMKIWTADINWYMPFALGRKKFHYNTSLHTQWNKTPLTSQDKIAIGGRYTVRGFSGERTLSAERGWYWRNDLAWQYKDGHQVYIAADTGHVAGDSAKYLLGQSLSGAAVGLKGQFKAKGQWSYDFFVGTPLYQPKYFNADKAVLGFNVMYGL